MVVEVQAFDFAVVIGQHVDAFAIRVVATAIFVDVRENLRADGRGIVALTNRFQGERGRISLSFVSYFFVFFLSLQFCIWRGREQEQGRKQEQERAKKRNRWDKNYVRSIDRWTEARVYIRKYLL